MLNNLIGALAPTTPLGGSYESIATTVVGSGGTSSVTFSLSGVSGYKHLQVRGMVNGGGDYACWLNSDTTPANYNRHLLFGAGASVAEAAYATSYGMGGIYATSAGAFVQDFLDYKSTNKKKVSRSLWGFDANGSGYIGITSGLWLTSSAITSIQYAIGGGGTIPQYSSFALYGIKG